MLKEGEILGGTYQVIREIGKGGVGIIYLGNHLRLQTNVVIKKIKESVAARVDVRREADILKRLHHTGLPQVYDFIDRDGEIYTVMEYIPGENLQYYLDNGYTFPEQTVYVWLLQLLEVLSYLHSQHPKILHCDIKPANIMVTPDWQVKLIDFNVSLDGQGADDLQGISRIYAAPEQYADALDQIYGRKPRYMLDERMDLYSLAAVCYRMMAGIEPDAERGVPTALSQMNLPYSPALVGIVERALSPDPGHRFASAMQMHEALLSLGRADPQVRQLRRLQIVTVTGGAAAVLLGFFLILAGWNLMIRDLWTSRYDAFCILTEDIADEETASAVEEEGKDLLNSSLLRGYLNAHVQEKAKICYAVADSYYDRSLYSNAAVYYAEALRMDPQNVYLRDYLIALIRSGRADEVDAVTADYPQLELDEAEMTFLEAQMCLDEGDDSGALTLCEEALSASDEAELSAQICLLQTEIYTETSQMRMAAESAGQALSFDESDACRRMAAQTAFAAGQAEEEAGDDAAADVWYEKARGYYETLCGDDTGSYSDRLNLAKTFYALAAYEDGVQALTSLNEDYPDTREVLMWLCYCYIGAGTAEGDFSDVADDLQFRYRVCRSLYLAEETTDEDMETLDEWMELLEEYLE